jgi:hypothetical protein
MIVDFKSTPLEPLALKARVVQFYQTPIPRMPYVSNIFAGSMWRSRYIALIRATA